MVYYFHTMTKTATKVGISIPHALYRKVEETRRKSGKSRSAVMQEALRYWLFQQKQRVLIRQYEAGYRMKPESRREIQAAEASATRLLSSQEW